MRVTFHTANGPVLSVCAQSRDEAIEVALRHLDYDAVTLVEYTTIEP
jgi:hypothetical protein